MVGVAIFGVVLYAPALYLLHYQDQEMFVDTINTPTVKKKLLKLSAQDPGESRRRWNKVTDALWKKDIDSATDAKHAVRRTRVCVCLCLLLLFQLEEKQRADLKERQQKGVEWKQAVLTSLCNIISI